ncbi:hypothetical protein SADUNF_Sadunf12G0081800 [Salix dunnii]|uniref:UBA domain-containing protein n=1 Tax=Salix dunnii TaxID=1413687 RepID=A0A835JNN9_9ROSI|nr:hypothetical protein SADUNF_Sadunf12G0081800 [Salix dunnii]
MYHAQSKPMQCKSFNPTSGIKEHQTFKSAPSQGLRDHQTFASTARYWTETFAKASSLGVEEKVQKLVEMGFPEALARNALESVRGDENFGS